MGGFILKNTFIHIPGISKDSEKKLWESRITDWDKCIQNISNLPLSESKKQILSEFIPASIDACNSKNHSFFSRLMQNSDHWRAYPEFGSRCCFLDIETTGLDRHYCKITTIAVFDGNEPKTFVNGINLDEFPAWLSKYSMIVTFNGLRFDLPFIKARFPQAELSQLHIDLMYSFWNLGERGGLKKIEKRFGLKRDDEIEGMDGFEAVRLWHRYTRGDKRALELLLKYNIEDVKSLKALLDIAYPKLREKTLTI